MVAHPERLEVRGMQGDDHATRHGIVFASSNFGSVDLNALEMGVRRGIICRALKRERQSLFAAFDPGATAIGLAIGGPS